MNKRWTILIGGVLIVLVAVLVFTGQKGCIEKPLTPGPPAKELRLWDFPDVFREDTIIVLGDNASKIERDSAEGIAENLEQLTRNKPEIISSRSIKKFKRTYNLIVIGTPKTNSILLEEIYKMTDATKVTKEYPGEKRGILQILRNPWNSDKALLIVTGSDEWGVKAGGELLEYAQDLDETNITIEWKDSKPIFPRIISKDKYVFIEIEKRIKIEPTPPHLMSIDRYPLTYYFDEISGNLKIWAMGGLSVKDKLAINDDLLALIGNTIVIEKLAGSGRGIMPPVYTVPFSFQREDLGFLKIVYLKSDGTVYLRYEDKKIVIGSEEEYETSFRKNDAIYTVTIKNHGLLDKSKIIVE